MKIKHSVSFFLMSFSCLYGTNQELSPRSYEYGRKTGENIARSLFEQGKRLITPKKTKMPDKKIPNLVDQLYLDLYAGKRIAIPQKFLNSPQTIKFNKATFNATPLMAALLGGYVHVVEYLLNEGADPNGANKDDIVPLHLTARAGTVASTNLLLRYGADPNKIDKDGMTPLMHAVLKNKNNDHLPVIKLLIEYNADRSAQNNKGESALTFARAKHDDDVIRLLLQRHPEYREPEEEDEIACPFGLPM